MNKVTWTVERDGRYVKVHHSQRGLICTGVLNRDGRIVDIAFLNEANQRCNMIRMPAMLAMQRWENSQLDPIIDARGCSRDCARVHAGWTLGVSQ